MERDLIVVWNDMQVGGTTALMPKKVILGDGGESRPSKTQKSMLRFWEKCWEHVFEVADGCRVTGVLNGEPCDGDHHKTWQLWSKRMTDQKTAAVDLLTPINSKLHKLYCTRGTPAHSGNGFDADTEVAKELGAVGLTAHPKIRLTIQGNTFLFTHKGPTPGARPWTWGDSFRRELRTQEINANRYGRKLPSYWVWAHFHQKVYEPYMAMMNGKEQQLHGYMVPGWQLSTAYISALLKGEDIMNIGMLYFLIENGKVSHHWLTDDRDVTPEFNHG